MTKGPSLCHIRLEVAAGDACGAGSDVARRAGTDDLPARVATARAHVDCVIGVTDKVEVVFDHDNRGALGNEAVEHTQQHLNIERM